MDNQVNFITNFTVKNSNFFTVIGKMEATFEKVNATLNKMSVTVDRIFAAMGKNANVSSTEIVDSFNKVSQSITVMDGKLDDAKKKLDKLEVTSNKNGDKLNKSFTGVKLSAFVNNVQTASSALENMSEPGMKLSTSMYDLSSLTGVTGSKLKEIEGYARSNAKAFGGDAAGAVESYKLILGQLNPEIAKTPAALKAMGTDVSVLSKQMGNDAVAATEVLTTSMNQFGVDLSNPTKASETMTRMMNAMAAGAKEGSAELPQIKNALEQSGMAAKASGLHFEETIAAIEVLDKAGKKGAEGGVALRNALAIMDQGRFMPKETKKGLEGLGIDVSKLGDHSLSLTQRLNMLKPVLNDSALLTKMFGTENKNAALALIDGSADIDEMKGKITGTNTAFEMAATVMESPAEKAARIKAKVDDLKISLFNTGGGFLQYAGIIGQVGQDFTGFLSILEVGRTLINGIKGVTALFTATEATQAVVTEGATAAQVGLNMAFLANPITWIIVGIVALIAVISWLIHKTDGWGEAWKHTVLAGRLLWQMFTSYIKLEFDTAVDGIMIGINKIKAGWYEFKNAVGMGDEAENNTALAAINADTEKRKNEIKNDAVRVAQNAKGAWNELRTAANSIHFNNGSAMDAVKGAAGILTPNGTPGAVDTGNVEGGTRNGSGGAGKSKSKGSKTNEAIATGGTKNTTIHISIGKQIETLKIEAANVTEGADRMTEIVADAMNRVLAMADSMGDN